MPLQSVMDTHKCQEKCGKHYARPACEFNFEAKGPRELFEGNLEVQVYEATTKQSSKKELIRQKKAECKLIIKEKVTSYFIIFKKERIQFLCLFIISCHSIIS